MAQTAMAIFRAPESEGGSKSAIDTVLDTTHAEVTENWEPVISVYTTLIFFYRNRFVNTSQYSGRRYIDGTDEI